jgi:hypothetical protein
MTEHKSDHPQLIATASGIHYVRPVDIFSSKAGQAAIRDSSLIADAFITGSKAEEAVKAAAQED